MDMEPVDPDDLKAEHAFEALRGEVAALRRGMELMYRQMQQARPQAEVAGPDYSLTFGEISQALKAVERRLGAIEDKPPLREVYARPVIDMPGPKAETADTTAMRLGLASMSETSQELKNVLVGARSRRGQQRMLGATGIVGLTMGVLLWFLAVATLPWGGGHRLAAWMINSNGRWEAGETLMQEADPYRWKRFVQIAQACSEGVQTDQCAAMITVRTTASVLPKTLFEIPKAELPRGKLGQEH